MTRRTFSLSRFKLFKRFFYPTLIHLQNDVRTETVQNDDMRELTGGLDAEDADAGGERGRRPRDDGQRRADHVQRRASTLSSRCSPYHLPLHPVVVRPTTCDGRKESGHVLAAACLDCTAAPAAETSHTGLARGRSAAAAAGAGRFNTSRRNAHPQLEAGTPTATVTVNVDR